VDAAALPSFLALVGFASAAVLIQAARHPVQRRLGFRNLLRRPAEALLVIGGSLLGTALITGSFIVGDTLDSSIRASVHNQLGPIDEFVVVPERDRALELLSELRESDDSRIDGVMPLVTVQASVVNAEGGRRRSEPESQLLEIDFDEAHDFGGDPEVTGMSGATPGPGEVAITEDLAEALNAERGDSLSAYVFERKIDLSIVRILPRRGIAGFWLGQESRSSNAFIAPGTLAQVIDGRLPVGAVPPATYVLVSNRGGVEEGADLTSEVVPLIEGAASGGALRVEPVKSDGLDEAETAGDEFSELFLAIGAFAVLAGILLLVNIFVMLAEERKPQLGMLRAVGMRRSDLIRMFVIEGTIYTLVSSLIGALLGIGVGWAIATLAAPIFGGFDEFALELRFDMTLASLIGGYCLGALISWFTVLFTSFRISRINIIAAIRDLPESKIRKTRVRSYVFGALGVAFGGAWFSAGLADEANWAGALLGPPLIGLGLLPFLGRAVGRRIALLIVAAFTLFWGIFGNSILGDRFFESGDIFAFVAQGTLLTFAAVVLLSQTQEEFEAGIHRVAARNLPLRLGIAYPLARRFRTGLTLGMYSLVIFTMTFIAVLSSVFGGQVEETTRRGAGAFDVLVTSNETNPAGPERLAAVDGVAEVATMWHGGAIFRAADIEEPVAWPVTGVDEHFVEVGPPKLEERDPEFSSDADVWQALLQRPNTLVIDEFFLNEGGGGPPMELVKVGETVEVADPTSGEAAEWTVIGALNTDLAFAGSFASVDSVRDLLGPRVAPSWHWLQTDDSSNPQEVAQRIQGSFFKAGAEADSFKTLVEDFQSLNLQFFRLMQGYLALGLVVGIAGLGVVMVRSVRERRREIGVLRSLGFLRGQVRSAFLLESGFTAIEGIVVGSILALVTAAQMVNSGEFGESAEFGIPWLSITILTLAALVASVLAALWPARQASEVPPAVALRIAE
jgi:putative ABC transport system permease protein